MYKLIIADTSCLILLSKINRLDLLCALFETITVTTEVADEFGEPLPLWIDVKDLIDRKRQQILLLELDKGESSAIALALENETSLLLIDERKGRGIAQKLGLNITGTLGILLKAKQKKLIDSLEIEIKKLKLAGFWISDAIVVPLIKQYDI
jgi:predicted nucleic acid-binding protein